MSLPTTSCNAWPIPPACRVKKGGSRGAPFSLLARGTKTFQTKTTILPQRRPCVRFVHLFHTIRIFKRHNRRPTRELGGKRSTSFFLRVFGRKFSASNPHEVSSLLRDRPGGGFQCTKNNNCLIVSMYTNVEKYGLVFRERKLTATAYHPPEGSHVRRTHFFRYSARWRTNIKEQSIGCPGCRLADRPGVSGKKCPRACLLALLLSLPT